MASPHLLALFGAEGERGGLGRYNEPMTTPSPSLSLAFADQRTDLLSSLSSSSRLPAPLTEADATRITAAATAAYAPATRAVYARAWSRWVHWCAGRWLVSFPAEAAVVCAYLTERAEEGVSLSTIDQACSAIGHQHRHHAVQDPIGHEAVRQVRRGLRRIVGRAPRRPAHPLSLSDLRQLIGAIDRTTSQGMRDTALILIGYAGVLRRSELAALTLADVEAKPGGLLLHLCRSKTDPERRGQVVGVAHGQHADTDPVAALDGWLTARGSTAGPLFISMRPGVATLEPISGNAVTRIVKDRAGFAGLGAERITAHSLRAGHATNAALAAATLACC